MLATRFKEMQEWRDAALDWTDPEGVHSMRVASRRLRSVLRDFTPYFRKRPLNSAGKKLKRVADTLGEVRDLDVALMALAESKTEAHRVCSSERSTSRAGARATESSARKGPAAVGLAIRGGS